MFKYVYMTSHTVRTNKKTVGAMGAMTVRTNASLDCAEEQGKVLLMLSKIHRVNQDAIELCNYVQIERIFKPTRWVKDKFVGMFNRFCAASL